jgi:hypothetical protein
VTQHLAGEQTRTRTYWEGGGLMLLWAALLLAPAALMLDLGLGYPLVKWACATGYTSVLVSISSASLLTTGLGVWLGSSLLQRLRGIARDDGGSQVDRSYFLALVGIGMNVLAALAIIAAAIPQLILSPCE